jgi:hypothetical protein
LGERKLLCSRAFHPLVQVYLIRRVKSQHVPNESGR